MEERVLTHHDVSLRTIDVALLKRSGVLERSGSQTAADDGGNSQIRGGASGARNSPRSPGAARVRFVHLNHTNPALHEGSAARAFVEDEGCAVADEGEVVFL